MPDTPEYNSNGTAGGGFLTSVEYHSDVSGVFEEDALFENVPCAVCDTETRPKLMTIPAMRTCPVGWTKEYEGIDLLY